MFAKFLFPKLLEAETVSIQTKLTREAAIERLNKVTGAPVSVSNLGSYFMREDPLFRGKIDSDGFEISIFQELTGGPVTNFSPPIMKGIWQGDDLVLIEGTIGFSRENKMLIKFVSAFTFVFGFFALLIPLIGLGATYVGEGQYSGDISSFDASVGSYVIMALGFLLLVLLVGIAVRILFYSTSVFLMNRSMRRSKDLITNFFL